MAVTDYTKKELVDKYEKKSLEHLNIFFSSFKKILGNLKDKSILDIGCGDGIITREFAKKGAKIIGIDKSKKMIEICNKKYINFKNLKFIKAEGKNLKLFENNSFDFVIINMVLLNIDTKKEILKIFNEVNRVMK